MDLSEAPMGPPAPNAVIQAGPARKQNVACDACRAKKVRCQRQTISEKCAQCLTKDSDCTSNYIEQLQAKQKKGRRSRGEGSKRRKKNGDGDSEEDEDLDQGPGNSDRYGVAHNLSTFSTYMEGESSRSAAGVIESNQPDRSLHMLAQLAPPTAFTSTSIIANHLSPGEKQDNLLRYLFNPYPVTHNDWGYNDISSIELCTRGLSDLWEEQSGQVWQEAPSDAHLALSDMEIKELAEELLETFFSIAHPRFPMFDSLALRDRYAAPDSHPDGPCSHPMVALSIAWGARLSEHPILARDREAISPRDKEHAAGRMRSRLVQLLVIRCREVAEVHKLYRVPTLENVQLLIILEPLFAQIPFWTEKYTSYHLSAAANRAVSLGYNTQEGLSAIPDEKARTSAEFAWRLICISDGFQSIFHRTQPHVRDKDLTLKPLGEDPRPGNGADTDDDAHSVVWYGAASTGASICRKLYAALWSTRAKSEGIEITALRDFVHANSCWRDNYLSKLGVPSKWPDNWDFLAAITAASTDAYYHTLWLVVDHAIRDFGVAELRAGEQKHSAIIEIESVRRRIREESEHGALRVAALTSVLLENGYLRLDPLILHHPMYDAGLFLAEQGRAECLACVLGLRQYSTTFPQFWECSTEIEELYLDRKAQLSGERNGSGSQSSVSTMLPLLNGRGGHVNGTPASGSTTFGSPLPAVARQEEQQTMDAFPVELWNSLGSGYTSLPDVRNVRANGRARARRQPDVV